MRKVPQLAPIPHETMKETENVKRCLYCDKVLEGNARKKFCNLVCRQKYHHELKYMVEEESRDIQITLKKNRRILKRIWEKTGEGKSVDRHKLESLGFQFKYVTHTFINKEGQTCACCYDFGYYETGDGKYEIVGTKEKSI